MDFANKLEVMIDKIPIEVNRWNQTVLYCNDVEQDLLHLLENKNGHLDACKLTKISKRLSDTRVKRRQAKYSLAKWKHLKKWVFERYRDSKADINNAKEQIEIEDRIQRKKLKDREASYTPRRFDNLFDDDFWESF